MSDQKNAQNAKSTSPSGQQDIVKPGPGQTTAPNTVKDPKTSQDIVKP